MAGESKFQIKHIKSNEMPFHFSARVVDNEDVKRHRRRRHRRRRCRRRRHCLSLTMSQP